jgi:hypothetical protein
MRQRRVVSGSYRSTNISIIQSAFGTHNPQVTPRTTPVFDISF